MDDVEEFRWTGGPRHIEHIAHAMEKVSEGMSDFMGIWIDGELVAFGGIQYEKNPGYGHLTMLNVREDRQSQGIGTRLVHALEERIRSRGYKVELAVEQTNQRAKKLYERLGYVTVGTEHDSWEEDSPSGGVQIYETVVNLMRKVDGLGR